MATLAIDPGSKVGVAVLDDAGRLTVCSTYDWYKHHFELIDTLRVICEEMRPKVVIEKPRKGSQRIRSRSLGHCEVKAMTLAAVCEHFGAKVDLVAPIYALTKNRNAFKSFFPYWKDRTSNHARDAACLGRMYDCGR